MTRVPRQIPGRDIRSLPLKPADAFLLSRIDAATDERDLAMLTGLSEAAVTQSLNHLFDLGVIDFVRGERGGAAAASTPDPPRPPPASGPTRRSTLSPHGSMPAQPGPRPSPSPGPAELDEDVELSLDRKRRILDLFQHLDELTYYELLGVPTDADKKQIKAAYYALAPDLHPDTYFRKRLGSYKLKIETIFSRLTLAHDALTHPARRKEYDAYLEQVLQNRALAAVIERAPDTVSRDPLPPSIDEPSWHPTETTRQSPESERSRRQTLARKLSGGIRRFTSGVIPAVVASGPPPSRHSPLADAASRKRRDEAERRAAQALGEGYLRQARYEAGEGRWIEASWSYAKACSVRPGDAAAHERVAFAILKMGGNPGRAVEFARRAVELSPDEAAYRLTLARAYSTAGLEKNAREELDRALALAPPGSGIERLVTEILEHARRHGKVG